MPQTNSTVEERIVEMRFDNKQFESGVKQTMSTLDKLKEKLVFKNDVKGLDNIQNSINRIDLSVAMRGIDAFQQKLSALQIFGKRIVENLADDFYGAIKKVENGIRGVFQQISTGGANRALNIEQAKFQLEGLHIAWEDIKGDIDYAVSGTAYGLDAAAKVAAQLSASQIQVGDDMKNALRGISGVAAMTNSTYEDIGRVFTQVAGAGRLYTQDMLQLSSRGLNVAAALATQLGKTEGEIREMVTKGQIDFKTFSTAMNEAFGEQATKANDTYTGSLSNVKAALSRIGADIKAGHFETFRQLFVDLIPKLNEFKKAFKPVENVIIEVEAAIGKLLQKIISMVDVTKLVSRIAKPIEKVGKRILDVVDVVTAALEQVDAPLKAMKEFAYVSREAAMQMSGFGDAVRSTAKEEKEALNLTEDMQKAYQAAQDIWNSGKYGNGQARIDALRAAGIDPDKTQQIIEEFIKNGGNWEEAIKKVSETTSEAVDENSEKAERLKDKIQTLATIFRNIKRTFKAVATSIGNIVSALFKSVTGSMEKFGVGDILIKITGKIADLAEKFVITKEKAEKLTKPVNVLLSVLKTIVKVGAGVVKFVATLLYNIGNLIYTLGNRILQSDAFNDFVNRIVDGIKTIINSIKALVESISKSKYVKQTFNFFKKYAVTAITYVGAAIVGLVDLIGSLISKIKTFAKYVVSFFDFKSNKFDNLISQIDTTTGKFSYFKEFIINVVKSMRKAFEGVANIISSLFTSSDSGVLTTFVNFFKSTIKAIIGLISSLDFSSLGKFVDSFVTFFVGLAKKLKELSLADIFNIIKDTMFISFLARLLKIMKAVTNFMVEVPSLISATNKVLLSTAKVNKSIARLNTAKAFAEIGKTVLMFAGAITLIMGSIVTVAEYIQQGESYKSTFDHALSAVSDIMGKVALVILSWIALSKAFDLATAVFTSKSKLHIPFFLQIGAFIASIGYTIKSVIGAINDLANMDTNTLSIGGQRLIEVFKLIGVFFTALSLITALINRFVGGGAADTTKGLYAISLVIVSVAASVDLLIVALAAIAGLNKLLGPEAVDTAISYLNRIILVVSGCVAGLMTIIGIFNKSSTSQDVSKIMIGIAVIFLSIAVSLGLLVPTIAAIAGMIKVLPEETFIAIGTVFGIILEIMALIALVAESYRSGSEKIVSQIPKIIISLIAIIYFLQNLADHITSPEKMGAVIGVVSGLALIIAALSRLLGVASRRNSGLDKKIFDGLAETFLALGVMIVPLALIADRVNNEWDTASIGLAMAGLTAVVWQMTGLMKAIGSSKPDEKAMKSLALVFASLGVILVPLMAFSENSKWDAASIGAAMLGLVGIVGLMAVVVKQIGDTKPDPWSIAALGAAFLGLALILVPLQKLSNENWQAYAVALGGLSVFVVAFGGMMKLLNAALTPAQILTTGGAVAAIAASMSLLTRVLCEMSTKVDVNNLVKIAITIGVLAAVFTGLAVVMSKFPVAIGAVLSLAGSILVISAAIGIAIFAIGKLMEMFPDLMKNLQEFAYTLGTLPGFIVKGFVDGLIEAFPKLGPLIRKLIGENVVTPAEDELQINSPSKVFKAIGNFVGQGFEGGIKESFTNMDLSAVTGIGDKIKGALPDLSGIGDIAGGNLLEGITDKLSLDGFNTENFKMPGLGDAIKTSVEEEIRGVDFTNLYSLDDLIADPSKYDLLKGAGETKLTAAYEALKAHDEFLAKYPTFDSWFADKSNFSEEWLQVYYDADEEHRKIMEDSVRKNYTDLSKLSDEVYRYTDSWKEYQDRVLKPVSPENVAQMVQEMQKAKSAALQDKTKEDVNTALVKVKTVDEDGSVLPFLNNGDAKLNLDFSNSSVKTNMDAVSGDISNAINAQTTKLENRLTAIETKVGTFDTNQLNRTNNLINRVGLLESAIRSMQLRLDTGALVGQLVGPMDDALGQRSVRKSRG